MAGETAGETMPQNSADNNDVEFTSENREERATQLKTLRESLLANKSVETIEGVESNESTDENPAESGQSESAHPNPEGEDNSELKTELERLKAIEKSYKELQAEFTRRSQKLKELENSKDTAKSPKENDREAKLTKLAEENPNAVELINYLLDQRMDARVKPVETRLADQNRRVFQQILARELQDFEKGPYSELKPEVQEMIDRAWSTFDEQPETLNHFLSGDRSLIKEILNVLRDNHEDRMAEMYIRWKKRFENPNSNKSDVDKANIGIKPKVKTENVLKTLTDHTEDELSKMSLSDLKELVKPYRRPF